MNSAFASALRALTITLPLILSLGGCTVFPTPEPPRLMDFPVPAEVTPLPSTQPLTLRVDTPFASEPFNSSRILAMPNAYEFRAYGGVRWRDTAPVILRDMLVEALRGSGAFASVISETNPANASATLVTDVRAFHTTTRAGQIRAIMGLHSLIIDNRSRETLCAREFRAEQPAASDGIEDVVVAFGELAETVAGELVPWASACLRPQG